MPHRRGIRTVRSGERVTRKMDQFDGKAYQDPGRTALLSCKHLQEFKPRPEIGDDVWCRLCRDYRKVLVLQSDYRARCRDCRYSRPFGRAMWAADQAARKHGDAKGHTVDRYDGTTLEWTYTPGGEHGEQLSIEDIPPF
jgi:hypothetical protein